MYKTELLVGLIATLGIMLCSCTYKKTDEKELAVEITPVLYDCDAIVTIICDDGFLSSGVYLDELARKYELCVTAANCIEFMGEDAEEWKRIEEKGNVEIISHSYTHTKMSEEANLDSEKLKYEIKDSISYYENNFTTSQIAFIPPENTLCREGYKLLEEAGIYAVRQGGRGLNDLSPEEGIEAGNWYNLLTYGIGDAESTNERNKWVDDAIAEKAWLIEMWHNITEEGQEWGYQPISIPFAEEHISYISQKENEGKIWVASMTEATKYIYEKQNAEVKAVYDGKNIKVELKCDINGIKKSEFDCPLTLKIKVPNELNHIKNFKVQKKQVCPIENQENRYLYLEMIPNHTCKIDWE